MRYVSIRVCACIACAALLALAAAGSVWGCARLDGRMTAAALDGFVSQILWQAGEGRWAEVRPLASRDAAEAMERHAARRNTQPRVHSRALGSGAWLVWVEWQGGERCHLRLDETTWHPLARPWRRRAFRVTAFERSS